MATKETKSPVTSKTIWFGIVCIALGVGLAVTELLAKSGTLDAGVVSTIAGIFAIVLRYKTTVAITLGIDDPTTPEDESKGERAAKDTGFALVGIMAFVAALGLIFTIACAGLTVREQQAVDASVSCGAGLFNTAIVCAPPCAKLPTKEDRKSCAVACVVSTLQTELPSCGNSYGDIYSESLGFAIEKAVDSVFSIYEALK